MKHPPMFLMLLLATALSGQEASGTPLGADANSADKHSPPRQDSSEAPAGARPEKLRPAA